MSHAHTHRSLGWSCVSHACYGHCRVRNIFEALLNQGFLLAVPVFATVSQGLLFLLVCSTFFLASFVDPGIYPRGKPGWDTPTYTSTDVDMVPVFVSVVCMREGCLWVCALCSLPCQTLQSPQMTRTTIGSRYTRQWTSMAPACG